MLALKDAPLFIAPHCRSALCCASRPAPSSRLVRPRSCVKSGNVLLTNSWESKLGDFGEARLSSDETMTSVGTIFWCAPEILRGDHYTEKVDVYSYGMLLFELLEVGVLVCIFVCLFAFL